MNRKPIDPGNEAVRQAPAEAPGQVLPFRRRGALFARNVPPPSPLPDLAEYERPRDEPDDYRHRMIMNGIALVATVLLVVGGIWIADVMAHMRKDQDCVLMGRTNCAHIEAPPRVR